MADAPWSGPFAAHPGQGYSRYAARRSAEAAPPAAGYRPDPQTAPGGAAPQAHGPGPGAAQAIGKTLQAAGAVVSLALVAGLAVWGYQLTMRDVTGVPVVRALQGPMRVQPDDPGGVAAPHQGLAVNAVAAEGVAAAPPQAVELAPAPMALSAADVPARSGAEVSAVLPAEAVERSGPTAPISAAAARPVQPEPADPAAAGRALAEAISRDAAPLTAEPVAPQAATSTPAVQAVVASAVVPASVPGVRRSPRPVPRPAGLVTRAAASPVDLAVSSARVSAPASAPAEVDPSSIPAGTRLVQLGAFASPDDARASWDRLSQRFPDMLEGKARVIQQAQSGGRTFYRLRAMGFEDYADARGFCAALVAGQAPCIPVLLR